MKAMKAMKAAKAKKGATAAMKGNKGAAAAMKAAKAKEDMKAEKGKVATTDKNEGSDKKERFTQTFSRIWCDEVGAQGEIGVSWRAMAATFSKDQMKIHFSRLHFDD